MKGLKYFHLIICAFFLMISGLSAQTVVTIGTQGVQSGTSGISPYNYYWESRRVQMVYTASEITAAGGAAGAITAIAWDVSEINGGNLVNYEIRMAHTSATDASAHNSASLTTVKTAHTLTPGSTGWRTISFDNSFNWNGTDNILVDVCWGVNSGYASNGQIWMYNSAANQTRAVNSISANQCGISTTTARTYKPRVQMTFTPACNAPVASITQICSGDYTSYNLNVNVSALGDAPSVNITDGTTTYFSSVGLGNYQINSLTSGKTIYVVSTADANCKYAEAFAMCDICSGGSVPSDECAAAPLIDLSQPFAGSTDCSYTVSAGSPSECGQSIDNDSWMRFIAASSDVEIDFTVGACTPQNRGIQLAVFSGTCGALTLVPGSCDGPGTYGDNAGLTSTWNFSGMTIGNTYYIRIDGYAGDLCDYYFEPVSGVVITPDNDECADAMPLICGGTDIASNILATAIDAPAGCVGGGTPSKGVWYSFTGAGTTVTVSTDNPGTNFDTQINIFTGTCGALVCVGGDDDSGTGTTSSYTFTAANGVDYFIYVDGDGTAEGQFELSLECCSITPAITNNTGTTVLTCSTPSISVTATGGTSYAWSGGSSTNTAANTLSSIGTYTVTVTSGACTATANINITQNITAPTAVITNNTGTTVLNCTTTSISLSASGGTSYVWSAGSSTNTANNSVNSPATYTVTVTAANGCTDTESITVTQSVTPPTAIITNNTGTTVLNCTTTSISLTASGGTSYAWSGGSSTNTANNSVNSPATYTVTVTAANGCTDTESITVTQNITAPTAVITNNSGTTVLNCTTTSISLTASGGTSYVWSAGSSTNTANNSVNSPATYTVTVTAANGCTDTESITVTQNVTPPTAIITNNTGTTILNCTTTSISLTASGGTSYVWSAGSSTNTANNSVNSPATYTVTVTAANGCTDTESITVTQNITAPTAVITNNSGTTVLNCTTTSISLTASGGTSYVWSGGSSTNTANNSVNSPATYTVTVTAANGCTDTESITVTQSVTPPTAIISNNTGTTVLDCTTTSISLTASGGTSYAWSGGSSTNTADNSVSSPATYTVTVTAANGCTDTESITVTQSVTPPTAIITNNTGTTELDCTTTSISLTAEGGDSYAWSGGSSTNTADNSVNSPATYIVTVTAANGCTDTESISVTQSVTPPTAVITNNTGTTVLDCTTTSISLTAEGGDSYAWSGGSSTNTADNSVNSPSTYTVTVTAANGCTDTESISVTQSVTPPTAVITNNTGTTVLNCTTTSISLTAEGGTSYAWSGGSSTNTADNYVSSPSTYTVTVTAANGCTDTESITVTQSVTPPTAIITNNTGTTVLDCTTTSISLTAEGGDSYAWSGGSSTNTADNSVNSPSTYTVTVTAANGCTDTESITVTQDIAIPSIDLGVDISICESDLPVILNAGTAESYQWNDNSTESALAVTESGVYSVVITALNGCTAADEISVDVTNLSTPVFESFGPYCLNSSSVTLPETSQNGISGVWTPSQIVTTTAGTSQYSFVPESGQCASSVSIDVEINSIITPEFASFGPYCEGDEADVLPAQSLNNVAGTWLPSVINTLQSGEATYHFTPSDTESCYGTGSVLISVHPYPQISAVPQNTEIYSGESVSISVSGASTVIWTPSGQLSCDDCANPLFVAPNSASFDSVHILVITATESGCASTDTIRITVLEDLPLVIPQGFSPNGDGVSDTWIIQGLDKFPENEVFVYNRWGALVYSKSSYLDEWDGKFNSDELLPAGTYYYVLKLNDDEERAFQGFVYLNY